MSISSSELGKRGEDLALDYLLKKGYKLVGRNIRLFCGEIDLLMQDGNNFVIVEVKTKSGLLYGFASEMITYKKRKKLLQLARALSQKFPKKTIRIDVVAIDNKDEIMHLESAVAEE